MDHADLEPLFVQLTSGLLFVASAALLVIEGMTLWLGQRSAAYFDTFIATRDSIGRYEADFADPAAVYRDERRRASYLKMYGNICHETRAQFVNFPWSSEPAP